MSLDGVKIVYLQSSVLVWYSHCVAVRDRLSDLLVTAPALSATGTLVTILQTLGARTGLPGVRVL